MNRRLLHTVLRRAGSPPADGTADAELVRRFAAARDEAAFTVLVHRHGPLVWAVCRQMLPDPADADDAFQAVFLAFLQSAGRLRNVTSVSGWLHGVAVRVCLKARRTAVRRKHRERITAKPEGHTPEPRWDDLHAAVHEEVERLPAPLRTAFVLCDLQGVRQPDAAGRLGWKLGTLSGRLTRARQALLKRLTARGLAPAVAVGSVAVGGAATGGGVPPALTEGVFALARNGPTVASSTVLELARGATEGMMSKVKLFVGSAMLTTGLMVTVGTGWLPTAGAQRPDPQPRPATTPAADVAPEAPIPEPKPATRPGAAPRAGNNTPAANRSTPPATTTADLAHAQRVEHTVVTAPGTRNELVKLIQRQEKAGWEFCGSVPVGDASELVFKRPKGGAATTNSTLPAANLYGANTNGGYIPAASISSPAVANGYAPTATLPAVTNRTLPSLTPSPTTASPDAAPTSAPKTTTSNPNKPEATDPTDAKPDAKLPSGFEMVPLKHAKASDVAKTLRELFTTSETAAGNYGQRQAFSVSADDRTNTVIFRHGRGAASEDVKAMIEKLDTPAANKRGDRP